MAATATRAREDWVAVDGARTFVRRTAGEGIPTVFVHGNPTHSEDWLPFLERLDGPGIALDLPGWGRTEVPEGSGFDFTMWGLGSFVGRFLEAAGIGEHRLVCHDWGSVALIAAQAEPQRVRKLVLINVVPLLPGFRWHWVARWFWRRRCAGELINATATKAALRLISRQASGTPGPLPPEFIDSAWRARHPGTWPEMLTLYRSAGAAELEAAGAGLESLDCPGLVVWGQDDPYLAPSWGRLYAERLPGAELLEVPNGGHWPWVDVPDVVDRVVGFLAR